MPVTVTAILTSDICFPTSLALIGPTRSTSIVILKTDLPDGLEGHGLTFTRARTNRLSRRRSGLS